MRTLCLTTTTILAVAAGSAGAADVSPPAAKTAPPLPALAQTGLAVSNVPSSALFLGLGGSYDSVNFGAQNVYAIGTSDLYNNGFLVSSGSAQGPADIHMNSKTALAPSLQAGYFQHFGTGDWLWGAKLSYNYLGTTSTANNPIIPQIGSFTITGNPVPVPFVGAAVSHSSQTSVLQEAAIIPFIGHSFERSYVYFGAGPTLSQIRTKVNGLVGFADIEGTPIAASGPPQYFTNSSWVFGGAAVVGVTYFFDSSWFIDLNYSYAMTENHTTNFSSTFSNQTAVAGLSSSGTLNGSSAWKAITQGINVTLNKAF